MSPEVTLIRLRNPLLPAGTRTRLIIPSGDRGLVVQVARTSMPLMLLRASRITTGGRSSVSAADGKSFNEWAAAWRIASPPSACRSFACWDCLIVGDAFWRHPTTIALVNEAAKQMAANVEGLTATLRQQSCRYGHTA